MNIETTLISELTVHAKCNNASSITGARLSGYTDMMVDVDLSLPRTVWLVLGEPSLDDLNDLLSRITKCSKVAVIPANNNAGIDGGQINKDYYSNQKFNHAGQKVSVFGDSTVEQAVVKFNSSIDRDKFDVWKPLITKNYAIEKTEFTLKVLREISKVFNATNLMRNTRDVAPRMFAKKHVADKLTVATPEEDYYDVHYVKIDLNATNLSTSISGNSITRGRVVRSPTPASLHDFGDPQTP